MDDNMNKTSSSAIDPRMWFLDYATTYLISQVCIYIITSYAWNSARVFDTFRALKGKGSLVLLSTHAGLVLFLTIVLENVYGAVTCAWYKFSCIFLVSICWGPNMIILLEFCLDFWSIGSNSSSLRVSLEQRLNENSRSSLVLIVTCSMHAVLGLLAAFGSAENMTSLDPAKCDLDREQLWFAAFFGIYGSIMIGAMAFMEVMVYLKKVHLRLWQDVELLLVLTGCRASVVLSIAFSLAYTLTADLICIALYSSIPLICYLIPNAVHLVCTRTMHLIREREMNPINRILTLLNPCFSSNIYHSLATSEYTLELADGNQSESQIDAVLEHMESKFDVFLVLYLAAYNSSKEGEELARIANNIFCALESSDKAAQTDIVHSLRSCLQSGVELPDIALPHDFHDDVQLAEAFKINPKSKLIPKPILLYVLKQIAAKMFQRVPNEKAKTLILSLLT